MRKQKSARRSAIRSRKTLRKFDSQFRNPAPLHKSLLEEVRESAEDMWNANALDESEEREFDFVDGVVNLIQSLLCDLHFHDREMAGLEEPHRPTGMPQRLSNREDAIKRLHDALEDLDRN